MLKTDKSFIEDNELYLQRDFYGEDSGEEVVKVVEYLGESQYFIKVRRVSYNLAFYRIPAGIRLKRILCC